MSVGKSRIGDLTVNSDFGAVLQILNDMSNELNKICVDQTRNGFDKKEIEDKLEEIDNYITRNPVIEKGRIEGSEDVKKIVDLLNQEVKGRLKNIELNIRKEDRAGFETIEKDFEKNKTNTMQKNLANLENIDIETKSIPEREEDANEVITNRTERMEKAKAYKDVVKELCDRDSSLDEPKVQSMLLAEVPKISAKLTTIEKREKNISKIKSPSEYKDIFANICKQVQKAKDDSKSLTKKDFNELNKNLKELSYLEEANPDIESFLLFFEMGIARENKNGVDVIKSIHTPDTLMDLVAEDQYQEMDWEEAIAETKEFYNEETKKDVEELVDYNIFKLYPNKVKNWKDGLKYGSEVGVRVSDIVSEISAISKDEMKLKKQVNSLSKDSNNMDKLELEKLKAEKRKAAYKDLSRRQLTTTAKLFGQDMELTNHRGERVDFSRVEDGSKEEVIEGLYDKVREDGNEEEIDRQYNAALPVEYRQAKGWFKNIKYKIKLYGLLPWKWGKKTLADQRKEDWVKSKIAEQIDDIERDALGNNSWTLTPWQKRQFEYRQEKVVEKVKKKVREDVVKKGIKNPKETRKRITEEYKKLQREDDEDFRL